MVVSAKLDARTAFSLAARQSKDTWYTRAEYNDTVGGMDVYTAVLDRDVRTPDEFAGYLRRRGEQAP